MTEISVCNWKQKSPGDIRTVAIVIGEERQARSAGDTPPGLGGSLCGGFTLPVPLSLGRGRFQVMPTLEAGAGWDGFLALEAGPPAHLYAKASPVEPRSHASWAPGNVQAP